MPHQVTANWREKYRLCTGKYLPGLQSSKIHPFAPKVHDCSWVNKSIQFNKHLSSSSLIAESFGGKIMHLDIGADFWRSLEICYSCPLPPKTSHEKRSNQLPQMIRTAAFHVVKCNKPKFLLERWKRIPFLSFWGNSNFVCCIKT